MSDPIHDNVSRFDTEFNLNWAKANPELFVERVKSFQDRAPITDWKHFMKLIAVRRDQPFDSVTDYVMEDKLYLRETGYDV